jgi:hypothetical protein
MRRRTFLGGMGAALGGSLVLPLIRQTYAQNMDTPRRFVFILEGNCIEPINLMTPNTLSTLRAATQSNTEGRRFFPRQYGHDNVIQINDSLSLAPSLDPLDGRGGRLDLSDLSSVVLGLSSTVTGGGHWTNFGALSCTRSTGYRAAGPTIDAILAASSEVRRGAPFDAVRVGIHTYEKAMNTRTCAYDTGRSAPVIADPSVAFTNLFGVVGDEASRAAFARKGLLLDYARRDVNAALATFSGNSRERAKLETYITSLETVQMRQQRLDMLSPSLAEVVPVVPTESALYGSEDPLQRLQAQFDLVQASLIGALTHVAVIAVGTGGGFDLSYPTLNQEFSRHTLHHMTEVPPEVAIPVIQAATRDLVGKAAHLARALAQVPEGNGTMLDNTLICVMSENGEQHHSEGLEWPCLLIGGQGMGFQTDGRTTVFPRMGTTGHRQVSNLFNTFGHAAGMDLNDFGGEGSARIALGPLGEIRV